MDLSRSTNGDFYGTTAGTVFKFTSKGVLTTLASFDGTDGETPTGLMQATNGDFYGTTYYNTVEYCGCGTVFKVTPSGTLTNPQIFDDSNDDGAYPNAGLIQAANGDLYGTTQNGRGNSQGGGTVFKMTPGGKLTYMYSFCQNVDPQNFCTDGEEPAAVLVQAANGDFTEQHSTGEPTATTERYSRLRPAVS